MAKPGAQPSRTWLALVPEHADDRLGRAAMRSARTLVRLSVTAPDRESLTERLACVHWRTDLTGVVSLLALAPSTGDGAAGGGCCGRRLLVQALGDAGIKAPLWCLTRGAVAVAAPKHSPPAAGRDLGSWPGRRA